MANIRVVTKGFIITHPNIKRQPLYWDTTAAAQTSNSSGMSCAVSGHFLTLKSTVFLLSVVHSQRERGYFKISGAAKNKKEYIIGVEGLALITT